MIVVSDTMPLKYLILVKSVHVLPALFGRVHAPSAVIAELSHSRTPGPVRAWVASPPGWLTVQDPARCDPSPKLGSGETAAIALAEELEADWVLIDERRGTREAQSRGLRVAATLAILEEAGARGLLDYYAGKEDRHQSGTMRVPGLAASDVLSTPKASPITARGRGAHPGAGGREPDGRTPTGSQGPPCPARPGVRSRRGRDEEGGEGPGIGPDLPGVRLRRPRAVLCDPFGVDRRAARCDDPCDNLGRRGNTRR